MTPSLTITVLSITMVIPSAFVYRGAAVRKSPSDPAMCAFKRKLLDTYETIDRAYGRLRRRPLRQIACRVYMEDGSIGSLKSSSVDFIRI